MKILKRALIAFAGLAAVASIAVGVLTVSERRNLDAIRAELDQITGPTITFSEDMVAGLPEPARRYFLHAIKPGTPLARMAHIEMSGEIQPSEEMPWAPFTARQVLTAGRGFLWQADASMNGLPVTASDHYLNNEGRMRIAPLSVIPVVNASGPDIARAASARAAIELIWWLPSSYFLEENARIEPVDDHRFVVVYPLGGDEHRMTFTVDDEGRLLAGELPRWGDQTESGEFAYIPFGGTAQEERTFNGYTIPTKASVGWWFGTERYREFFRVTLDRVTYDS